MPKNSKISLAFGVLGRDNGSDWNVQPSGTFTSRLSTDRSPSPLLDITTTATGLLCWRDSHPLEWQLASLHGHSRPSQLAPKSSNVRYAPKATKMLQRRE